LRYLEQGKQAKSALFPGKTDILSIQPFHVDDNFQEVALALKFHERVTFQLTPLGEWPGKPAGRFCLNVSDGQLAR
jgi:hypothetical protein